MMTEPEKCHQLVSKITDFLVDWIGYQMDEFDSIEGILLLDDIIGFVGDDQCKEYVVPYFKKIYGAFDAKVNFLHNEKRAAVAQVESRHQGPIVMLANKHMVTPDFEILRVRKSEVTDAPSYSRVEQPEAEVVANERSKANAVSS